MVKIGNMVQSNKPNKASDNIVQKAVQVVLGEESLKIFFVQ